MNLQVLFQGTMALFALGALILSASQAAVGWCVFWVAAIVLILHTEFGGEDD